MFRLCRIVTQVCTCCGGLLPPSPCHLYLAFLPMLSLPNLHTPCYSSNRPQCVTLPFLCACVLIADHLPINENMRCLVFCSCVSLLRMRVSRFIHVSTKDMNFSCFMAAQYSMVYMCYILFVQSIIDEHLGWFQIFAVVNSAAIDIHVHVSLQNYF